MSDRADAGSVWGSPSYAVWGSPAGRCWRWAPTRSRGGWTSAAVTSTRLALAGFCPVSLVEGHRLVPGQQALTVSCNGLVYRFADERTRSVFRKQPERFVPVNGGHCPVTQVERGERRPGEA